jgi:hypothetical protein
MIILFASTLESVFAEQPKRCRLFESSDSLVGGLTAWRIARDLPRAMILIC